MERLIFKDIDDLAARMIDSYSDNEDCVSVICHYDIATALLSELVKSDLSICQINIHDYEWNRYDKEYQLSIMDDKIYCSPAFVYSKDGYSKDTYLDTWANVVYIHQDSNSAILKHIECDDIYEFAVEDLDDIEPCEYDDEIVTHHSDFATVSRDQFGKPTGFSKSWYRDNGNGITKYDSYSCYCNDENLLKEMARKLEIEL